MQIRRNAVRTRRVQQGYIIEDVTLPTTLEQELLEKCIFCLRIELNALITQDKNKISSLQI